jgi:shikimate dehydrogenase
MIRYGLIGFPINHSFSTAYFAKKFLSEGLTEYRYDLFPMESADGLSALIVENPELRGLNVTIPHKVAVMKFLHNLDPIAEAVGAVNTIDIIHTKNKIILKGYNTDVTGFEASLIPFLKHWHKKALVLGTGGASKAVKYVLDKLGIAATFVSRQPVSKGQLSYLEINREIIEAHPLIIQTTPLGKYPDTETCPPIPYHYLTPGHLLFDLNYNPEITKFLSLGLKYGTDVKNGLKMLHLQADASWNLWKQSMIEHG